MNILLLEDNETDLSGRDPRTRHVRKVLNLGVGDTLRAGIVDGPAGTATILALDNRHMRLEFTPDPLPAADPSPSGVRVVDMVLGHPRPIVLRRMLRDLATVGVRRLFVVPTDLGEKSYLAANMWADVRPHLIEGASQAGVTRLMEVIRCESLADGIGRACFEDQTRILLHPDPSRTVKEVLGARLRAPVLVAVGSERGWTAAEVARFHEARFVTAGMGDRILRTETAASAAAWAVRCF